MISQTTGRIYLKRPVDFESTQKSYYVTVEASDGGLSSTAVVNVTVTDVNDNVPVCTQTENNVTVNEDMPVGSSVTLFIQSFIHLLIYLLFYLSIYLFVYLFIYLFLLITHRSFIFFPYKILTITN